jgi:predicted porin
MAQGHAQSSVTIYGIVDAGVQLTDHDRTGAGSVRSVVSGHRNGSRWGLRGSEDLGDGLAAVFQLEQGYFVDTGTLGQGGRAFGRHAYVGLSGRLGTLAFGRVSTFDGGAFDMFTEIDPFVAGYGVATLASTFSAAGGLRVDNALLYRTPRLGGFQAGVMHSFHANGAEGPSGGNTRFSGAGANFRSGPFYVAATWAVADFADASGFADQKMLYVGATYDLKAVKLHGALGDEKGARSALISSVGAAAEGTDATSWMLGVSVPFGLGRFVASFQKRDGKSQAVGSGTFDADRKVFGLAYEYALSRRTLMHASFGKSEGSNTLRAGTIATDFANRKEYTLGVTHFF